MPKNTFHKPRIKKQCIVPNDGIITNLTNIKEKYVSNSIVIEKGTDGKPGTLIYNLGDYGCYIKIKLSDACLDVNNKYVPREVAFGSPYVFRRLMTMKEIRENLIKYGWFDNNLKTILHDDTLFKEFINDAKKRFEGELGTNTMVKKWCFKGHSDVDSLTSNDIAGKRTLMNGVIEAIDYLSADRVDLCTRDMNKQGRVLCTDPTNGTTLYCLILEQRDLINKVPGNDNRRKFNFSTCEFIALDTEKQHEKDDEQQKQQQEEAV